MDKKARQNKGAERWARTVTGAWEHFTTPAASEDRVFDSSIVIDEAGRGKQSEGKLKT